MKKKKFFNKLNFNKKWREDDWEQFFKAQDDYRQETLSTEIRKKQMSRLKYKNEIDEVEAFEPVLREYGLDPIPSVLSQIQDGDFSEDKKFNEEHLYDSSTDEHFWSEGTPLKDLLIYRDACRFAITTAQEIDKYSKHLKPEALKSFWTEFEALRFHSNWVAINIAHGHRLGYTRDRILGNVAKSRRAITHINVCIGLINRISHKTKSRRLRFEVFSFAVQMRSALFDWIDEMKSH